MASKNPKQLYWTDAHFCGLRSQTNVYGLSKITSHDGLTRLLAASINGQFVTVEYQKSFDNIIPRTQEEEFNMTSSLHGPVGVGDIDIVSVDMFYKDDSKSDIVLAATYFLKLSAPYEEKAPSAFMNIYFLPGEEGVHVNFVDSFAMSQIQPILLDYYPLKLMHYQVDPGTGRVETCFLLCGNDKKIHLFRPTNDGQSFHEDPDLARKCFPEFTEVNACVTEMELKKLDSSHRLSAFGEQSGMVSVFLVNTTSHEIEKRWETDIMDTVITSIQLFSHHVTAERPCFLDASGDAKSDKRNKEPQSEEAVNLLITSALDPAIVFCDVLESDLSKRHVLSLSNTQDVVTCSCVMDIDFDGENEILIGTYGQVLLAYKLTAERTPGMLMTSTPFQSPKPVPVVATPVTLSGPGTEDKSPSEHLALGNNKRRHKSLAATIEGNNSPSKHEKHDGHRSDDSSVLDACLRDSQMTRLVRSQENLASASPRSVYFQTPENSESYDFLPHASFNDLSDLPSYRLKWIKRFPDPVMGLTCEDMVGDGMLDLIVLTLKGLHILQPDLNEVAELLLERLRPMCDYKVGVQTSQSKPGGGAGH